MGSLLWVPFFVGADEVFALIQKTLMAQKRAWADEGRERAIGARDRKLKASIRAAIFRMQATHGMARVDAAAAPVASV